MKEEFLARAEILFQGTGIQITCKGKNYLGSPLGSQLFKEGFVRDKVGMWSDEIETQAAFSALTHGLMSRWTYLLRCTDGTSSPFQPLEQSIHSQFIPTPNEDERLLALPARFGGLGITNPTSQQAAYSHSRELSRPLINLIMQQSADLGNARDQQKQTKSSLKGTQRGDQSSEAADLKSCLPLNLQRAVDLASEKGASSWVTALPLSSHGLVLHKGMFRDALCLRYNWTPPYMPTICVCGSDFSIEHALTCKTGGFIIMRHNEIRDLLANLLTDVCHNVTLEPHLQPLSGESLSSSSTTREENARLDVGVNRFWGGRFEQAYIDVRVFNTHAPSNVSSQVSSTYRRHEREKRLKYDRVRKVEQASFVPFVLSCTGGIGPSANVFLKRLGALLAEKHNTEYSLVMGLLRCRLNFTLLRAAVMCLHGTRSLRRDHSIIDVTCADLAVTEGNIAPL